ncbi:hypothetical protein WKI65_32800, partial [Streptomyces sp. MS1.AVA.3]|uniref:hypothetical protein n=1 Tax=Streptomyces decoyicus TaxID=249567 RepID=UPI0030BFA4E8
MVIERSDPVTRAQCLPGVLTELLNRRGDGWRAGEPNPIGLHVELFIQFLALAVVQARDEFRVRHQHGLVAVLLYGPGNVQEFLVGRLARDMPLHTVFGARSDARLLAGGSPCDKTCTRSGQSTCYSAKYGGKASIHELILASCQRLGHENVKRPILRCLASPTMAERSPQPPVAGVPAALGPCLWTGRTSCVRFSKRL